MKTYKQPYEPRPRDWHPKMAPYLKSGWSELIVDLLKQGGIRPTDEYLWVYDIFWYRDIRYALAPVDGLRDNPVALFCVAPLVKPGQCYLSFGDLRPCGVERDPKVGIPQGGQQYHNWVFCCFFNDIDFWFRKGILEWPVHEAIQKSTEAEKSETSCDGSKSMVTKCAEAEQALVCLTLLLSELGTATGCRLKLEVEHT